MTKKLKAMLHFVTCPLIIIMSVTFLSFAAASNEVFQTFNSDTTRRYRIPPELDGFITRQHEPSVNPPVYGKFLSGDDVVPREIATISSRPCEIPERTISEMMRFDPWGQIKDEMSRGNLKTTRYKLLQIYQRKKELKKSFDSLDDDGDGLLSYEDVKKVLNGFGENLTDDDAKDLIKEVKQNHKTKGDTIDHSQDILNVDVSDNVHKPKPTQINSTQTCICGSNIIS